MGKFKLLIIKILLWATVTTYASESAAFNGFPNYFQELVQNEDTTRVEHKIEQALRSVIERLHIPYVDKDGIIRNQGFFAKIEHMVREKDPEAKVYAAGGVVRSLLGYIYKKIYTAKQKNPNISTAAVLDKIIAGKTNANQPKEILSLKALGIGSDLDILIELSAQGQQQQEAIKQEVTDFINSVEKKAGLIETKTKLKYAVVPIGDVKDYCDQITRATAQGGSTLDWLAFPLTSASGYGMRMPEKYPQIFKTFIKGSFDYLPPSDPDSLKDPDKQTVRALRPLLEIPFLVVGKGKDLLLIDLEKLIAKTREGVALSPGAYEQFEKMIRNARFEGAHNRFYLPFPEDKKADRQIETLVFQLSEASKKGEKNLPLIPEFVINRNPIGRPDSCDLKKEGLLMDKLEFLIFHTDQGKLYHGTPYLDNILSVIRNGFIISSEKVGSAAKGRGAYATPLQNVAGQYGVPIEFSLKRNVEPRVLDWQEVQEKPIIKQLVREAEYKKIDPFQYLSEHCNVDIIINEYVLIQNSGIIELPKDIRDIILLYSNKFKALTNILLESMGDHSISGLSQTLKAAYDLQQMLPDYQAFYNLGQLLGIKELAKITDNGNIIAETYNKMSKAFEDPDNIMKGLEYPDKDVQRAAVRALKNYHGEQALSLYEKAFSIDDVNILYETINSLQAYQGNQLHLIFEKALSAKNPEIAKGLFGRTYQFSGNTLRFLFEQAFLSKNENILRLATDRIASRKFNFQHQEDFNFVCKKALKAHNPLIRKEALTCLEEYTGEDIDSLIMQILSDENLDVKKAGIEFLWVYNNQVQNPHKGDTFPLYMQLLSDPNLDVRKAVVENLFAYKGDNALALFKKAFSDNELEKSALVSAMYNMDGKSVEQVWIFALSPDAPEEIQRRVSSKLSFYRGSKPELVFTQALLSNDPKIRIRAKHSLKFKIKNNLELKQKMLPIFVQLFNNKNIEIRKEIAAIMRDDYAKILAIDNDLVIKLKNYVNSNLIIPISDVFSADELSNLADFFGTLDATLL